jgi:hypothetical protein
MLHRVAAFCFARSRLFELVRLDHTASFMGSQHDVNGCDASILLHAHLATDGVVFAPTANVRSYHNQRLLDALVDYLNGFCERILVILQQGRRIRKSKRRLSEKKGEVGNRASPCALSPFSVTEESQSKRQQPPIFAPE